MNDPGAEHTLVAGISPAATSLRSWTAAGLEVLHVAISAMQSIALLT